MLLISHIARIEEIDPDIDINVINSSQMDKIEKFILRVSETSLGTERMNKFMKSTNDDLRKLPPSRGALFQHENEHVTKPDIYSRNASQILCFQTQNCWVGDSMIFKN